MTIASAVKKLQSDFGLTPIAACEIEFYLDGSEEIDLAPFWDDVGKAAEKAGIGIYKTEKEWGIEQHEIALMPADPMVAATQTVAIKNIVTAAALHHGMKADFSARPYPDQFGSGLHVHVHLENAQKKNVFYKDDKTISDPLRFCIGGLLAALPRDMDVFASTAESMKRFVAGSNGPLTISWGANNRTVAVRLPESAHDNKRIEHRVSGADADPHKVIEAILRAMHNGLTQKLDPGPQCYGDASLSQYNLPSLVE